MDLLIIVSPYFNDEPFLQNVTAYLKVREKSYDCIAPNVELWYYLQFCTKAKY